MSSNETSIRATRSMIHFECLGALGQLAQQTFLTCMLAPFWSWCVCVCVCVLVGWMLGVVMCSCMPTPRVHSTSTHTHNTPAALKQHTCTPGPHNMAPHAVVVVCVCACVCVCVHVCVCGGETQPLVGVDLERWTGDVMASPQGPSSCFGGHWCHHTGPRSPKMAARALLAQVSGQHTPTARLGRLNR